MEVASECTELVYSLVCLFVLAGKVWAIKGHLHSLRRTAWLCFRLCGLSLTVLGASCEYIYNFLLTLKGLHDGGIEVLFEICSRASCLQDTEEKKILQYQ